MTSTDTTMTAERRHSVERGILSPDGRFLAVPGANHTALVLDAATNEPWITYYGHQAGVYRRMTGTIKVLAWLPGGSSIASGSSDGSIHIWHARSGIHQRTLTQPQEDCAVLVDLARLEQNPGAIHDYHQEIQRRIAYQLPPLEETLRLREGAGLHAKLCERASAFGIATLRPDSLLLLAQLFREEGLEMADHLFGPHAATLRAREKQALLPGGAQVQKTVSLLVGGRLVLVTWIGGDRLLGRAERFALVAKLGLSRKEARQATLNPPGCVAEQEFGLLRGMVSPFLPAGYGTGLRAVVQLSWPQVWEDEGRSVAISLSPCESLLIPLRCYRRILCHYIRQSIPDVPLVELDVSPGPLGEIR